MSGVSDPSETHGRLIAASKVNGTTVYNTAGEKLGSVYDVMIDKRSGKAEYAIMSFGGFLGIGDSYHPLPWQALTYSAESGRLCGQHRPFAARGSADLRVERYSNVG